MPWAKVRHVVDLNIEQETRFADALTKKYGEVHPSVNAVIRAAIMEWVEKVERENQPSK